MTPDEIVQSLEETLELVLLIKAFGDSSREELQQLRNQYLETIEANLVHIHTQLTEVHDEQL